MGDGSLGGAAMSRVVDVVACEACAHPLARTAEMARRNTRAHFPKCSNELVARKRWGANRPTDGLSPGVRYLRKPADVVICPGCDQRWRRTNRQKADGVVIPPDHKACHAKVTLHSRLARTWAERRERYRRAIAQHPQFRHRDSATIDAIVDLMQAAFRDGLTVPRAVHHSKAKSIPELAA